MSAAPPTQEVPAPDPGAGLKVVPARSLPAGEGWTWIVQGWKLFARAPLMWILSILIVFVVAIVMGLVPIVGSLAFNLINAAIGAGFMVACRSLETGGDFELEHLFAGFRTRFVNLLVVGVLLLAASILIFVVFAAFVGFSILPAILRGDTQSVASAILGSLMSILVGGLVAAALWVPVMAAYWFAPALVVLNGLGPVEAMKESFMGCMRNVVPFLVYGIVMLIFCVLAVIPVMLGYLVLVPVMVASTYAAYRAIYTEDEQAAPVLPLS